MFNPLYALIIGTLVFASNANARDDKHDKDHRSRSYSTERSDRQSHQRQHPRQDHRRDFAESRRHQDDRYRERSHRRDHYSHRYDHKPNKRHSKKYRDRKRDYFLGGLVLGSLGTHFIYENGSSRDYRGDYFRHDSYWRDRWGDCYRVEHRKRGKVYVQVPRRYCY